MTKNICIYGAPGSGKSTTAAGLFYEMKKQNIKVEYVDEVAKELTYSKDFKTLADQVMVFARQRHKMEKLEGQVHFTINDGPFLLSAVFSEYSDCKNLPLESFNRLVIETYKMYNTINIFLEPEGIEYQEYGRNETQAEAKVIGSKIKSLMKSNDIPFIEVEVNEHTVQDILKLI